MKVKNYSTVQCHFCGKTIERKVPWTKYCVDCRSKANKDQQVSYFIKPTKKNTPKHGSFLPFVLNGPFYLGEEDGKKVLDEQLLDIIALIPEEKKKQAGHAHWDQKCADVCRNSHFKEEEPIDEFEFI